MKCKKCSHRTNSLPAMAEHYRKKHPGAMKRKKRARYSRDDHLTNRAVLDYLKKKLT